MKTTTKLVLGIAVLLIACPLQAEELTVEMLRLTKEGTGQPVGIITAVSSTYGVIFVPELHGLPPGSHGFHVHENPSCQPAEKDGRMTPGEAAGGHFDPQQTGTHAGPYGEGHLGDLPALYAEPDGRVTVPVLAPRVKLSDLRGHALMIHEGGDTYSDQPHLGGGGSRLACGVMRNNEAAP